MTDWCCGMKAVCIHDGPWWCLDQTRYLGPAPTVNSVSTISAVYSEHGAVFLRFYEYPANCGITPGFRADLFRPLCSRKTNIELFRRLVDLSRAGGLVVEDERT